MKLRLLTLLLVLFNTIQGVAQIEVSGIVVDAKNGEPLIGANILIDDLLTGSITNEIGYFSIVVPAKGTSVTFSYLLPRHLDKYEASKGSKISTRGHQRSN